VERGRQFAEAFINQEHTRGGQYTVDPADTLALRTVATVDPTDARAAAQALLDLQERFALRLCGECRRLVSLTNGVNHHPNCLTGKQKPVVVEAAPPAQAAQQRAYEAAQTALWNIAPGYNGGGAYTKEALQAFARQALTAEVKQHAPAHLVEVLEIIANDRWQGMKVSKDWMTRLANQAVDLPIALEAWEGDPRVTHVRVEQYEQEGEWYVENVNVLDAQGNEVPPAGFSDAEWNALPATERRATLDKVFPALGGPTADNPEAPDFLRPGLEAYTLDLRPRSTTWGQSGAIGE
jgi:hypothetical protein